jgi:hypothetical protein
MQQAAVSSCHFSYLEAAWALATLQVSASASANAAVALLVGCVVNANG